MGTHQYTGEPAALDQRTRTRTRKSTQGERRVSTWNRSTTSEERDPRTRKDWSSRSARTTTRQGQTANSRRSHHRGSDADRSWSKRTDQQGRQRRTTRPTELRNL